MSTYSEPPSFAAGQVETVLGPVAPDQLGETLMHDHLVVDWDGAIGRPRLNSVEPIPRIHRLLQAAREVGVGAMVDPAPEQFGAQPLLLRLIAERAPVHIVAATGLFAADYLPLPGWVYPPATAHDIAQRMVATARDGLAGSGVRPGIIKVGSSGRAISELEETIFRAAAMAQRMTGLPVTTHTDKTRFGDQQIDILEQAGADLSRVVIGHMGWGSGPDDFELHASLVRRGVTIGLDLVGEPPCSTPDYARMAVDLIEAGFASQIVFSHDTVLHPRGLDGVFGPEWTTGDLTVVHRELRPLLQEAGVEDSTWRQILIENPRRLLTRAAPIAVDGLSATAGQAAFPPAPGLVNA